MEFFTSTEFQLGLIIELGILLLIALGVIFYLARRLLRVSCDQPVSATNSGHSVRDYLHAEIKKTRDKQTRLGKNSDEASRLRAACDLRCHVLEGEIRVLESVDADDEMHYWRPVHDYYVAIHAEFSAKIDTLEERLKVSQQRTDNLEKFKQKVFVLRDHLNQVYENNTRLEKELRKKIKEGAKLSELEHTLNQMEREKENLLKELQLAEHEFVAIMENAAKGTTSVTEVGDDMSGIAAANMRENELRTRQKELEKENEFLCRQIQTLLSEELKLENSDQKKNREFLALEKRYARMEARYLDLQEELDKRR